MTTPKYVMNTETGVIYPHSDALLALDSPRFVPFQGELPPFDFKAGQRVVKKESFASIVAHDETASDDERIERIAAVLPMIKTEDCNDKGFPGLLAVEKLSMLKDVKRSEVKRAMDLRKEIVNARDIAAKAAAEGASAEE